MSEILTKIEIEHRHGCYALDAVERGDWPTPWSGVLDRTCDVRFVRKNATGSGHTMFWRIACNDTACPARLLVKANDVLAIIAAQEAAHV